MRQPAVTVHALGGDAFSGLTRQVTLPAQVPLARGPLSRRRPPPRPPTAPTPPPTPTTHQPAPPHPAPTPPTQPVSPYPVGPHQSTVHGAPSLSPSRSPGPNTASPPQSPPAAPSQTQASAAVPLPPPAPILRRRSRGSRLPRTAALVPSPSPPPADPPLPALMHPTSATHARAPAAGSGERAQLRGSEDHAHASQSHTTPPQRVAPSLQPAASSPAHSALTPDLHTPTHRAATAPTIELPPPATEPAPQPSPVSPVSVDDNAAAASVVLPASTTKRTDRRSGKADSTANSPDKAAGAPGGRGWAPKGPDLPVAEPTQPQRAVWSPQGPDSVATQETPAPELGAGAGQGGTKAGRRHSTSSGSSVWAPKGPDLQPTASDKDEQQGSIQESDTSTATALGKLSLGSLEQVAAAAAAKKKAPGSSAAWLGTWGSATNSAAGSGSGSGSGSSTRSGTGLLGRISPGVAEGGQSSMTRKLAMLQSWGQAAGGAGAGGAAKSSTSAVAVVGPSMEQLPSGEWVLRGCDADLANIPSWAADLRIRLTAAIRAEQEAEAEALQALYARTSVHKLQRDGVVLVGLRAKQDGELYRSVVWRFELPAARGPQGSGTTGQGRDSVSSGSRKGQGKAPNLALPYHKFRQGDSVLISRYQGDDVTEDLPSKVQPAASVVRSLPGSSTDVESDIDEEAVGAWYVEAAVLEVKRTHLLLALERKDSDRLERQALLWSRPSSEGPVWRIDASVKDVTANRQKDALSRLDEWTHSKPPAGEALVRLALLCGRKTVPLLAEQPPLWARDPAWREAARRILAQQNNLNDSQRRAVARAMVQSMTLWQGPPGTGKTRTLLALIAVLVGSSEARASSKALMGPLLACADTNAAVDNIVEGLQARGMRVVRVGNPAKVRSSLRHVTLEALAERDTAEGRQAARVRSQAQQKLEELRVMRERAPASVSQRTVEQWAGQELAARNDLARADQLLKLGMDLVMQTAQVVCSTCTGAGDHLLSMQTFRVVVIDEASQATEPATLIPLVKGAQCVVMAGDPKQLPPTVTSRKALDYQLDVTLFERLNGCGLLPLLLDTQYRMHPTLSAFASQHFYSARLRDGVTANDKVPPKGFPWLAADLPVAFLQVSGAEERASAAGGGNSSVTESAGRAVRTRDRAGAGAGAGGASYRNQLEARAVMKVLELLVAGGDVSSVALLTPYSGQVRLLESSLRQLPAQLASKVESGQLEVTASSVDGFQGREADAVIFSAVRCNARGAVGFVADPRRLNVAITRPRRGLVVVGCDKTLSAGSEDWRQYLEWLTSKGAVVPVERALGQAWRSARSRSHVPSGGGGTSDEEWVEGGVTDTEDADGPAIDGRATGALAQTTLTKQSVTESAGKQTDRQESGVDAQEVKAEVGRRKRSGSRLIAAVDEGAEAGAEPAGVDVDAEQLQGAGKQQKRRVRRDKVVVEVVEGSADEVPGVGEPAGVTGWSEGLGGEGVGEEGHSGDSGTGASKRKTRARKAGAEGGAVAASESEDAVAAAQ